STPTPALAQLLRGGRGGEVKLKLLLSVLWIAASPPYDTTMPGRIWAELIGLPDPGRRGTHRISAATRQLKKQNFVTTRSRPGEPTEIVLLNETGSGEPYTSPGQRVAQLARAEEDFERDRYFRVPKEFWTNGWVAVLDGPAVAMLLVLLSLAAGRSDNDLWIAPEVADRRFHLSAETRKKGFDRLRDVGLVTVHRRPVTRQLDSTRHRNVYDFNREVMTESVPK
uniref:hypothetical protein n=2 Tax=Pseudonocardia sp. ICBG1034 TaxID=2844381 RepID=UPI001CCBC7EE